MLDIQLAFDPDEMAFDIVETEESKRKDIQGDDGLFTAVIVSLFTDARAHDDDALPDERLGVSSDKRGWWGDLVPDIMGDGTELVSIGSRLWLLWREKELDSVVVRAQQYAEEALQWLIDQGYALSCSVTASHVESRHLGIDVRMQQSGTDTPGREWNFLYDYKTSTLVAVESAA